MNYCNKMVSFGNHMFCFCLDSGSKLTQGYLVYTVYEYVCIYVCMHTCVCVCVCLRVLIQPTYIYFCALNMMMYCMCVFLCIAETAM